MQTSLLFVNVDMANFALPLKIELAYFYLRKSRILLVLPLKTTQNLLILLFK